MGEIAQPSRSIGRLILRQQQKQRFPRTPPWDFSEQSRNALRLSLGWDSSADEVETIITEVARAANYVEAE